MATASGVVTWWRGETNTLDQVGTNTGTLAGNTGYAPGQVGQAFVFDGRGDGVSVGNPASLQLQSFTIEAWIKRGSASVVSYGLYGDGIIFGYGYGGYGFYMDANGSPALTKLGISAVNSGVPIADTGFHHVAVTKSGSAVVFYVDGVAHPVAGYDPGFTFTTPAAIGARGDNLDNSFLGTIDEMSIYNRSLSAGEIQSIYNAGGAGKCGAATPPSITSQPGDQTVAVDGTATFTVTAAGTAPLSYQWQLNGSNVSGATATALVLANVQFANAGIYSVVVSNLAGMVTSSNATLTVTAVPGCALVPSGLVSWWRAEANALDQAGTNNGTLAGNLAYGSGRVGQAFVFDGNRDAVLVGNPVGLNSQNFTIETWIKRANPSVVSYGLYGDGVIFGYGDGGYAFYMDAAGRPALSQLGISAVNSGVAITDTNFHHLAITKSNSTVVFYVDGVAHQAPAYNPAFAFTSAAAIGARGDNLGNSFLGTIDELSAYNRALSPGEVQAIYTAASAGKCTALSAPFVVTQPISQTVTVGGTAAFSVTASGTAPLNYQWQLNGSNITGATASLLTLVNVQTTDAGNYSVSVSNLVGTVNSSNAVLTVTEAAGCLPPPPGLVSWWRSEANALDQAGQNNGTLAGNTTYGSGQVGQAFVFDGNGDGVTVGNPASLQLQDFTIEAWIKRASASVASFGFNGGLIFGYGGGGYALGILDNGTPFLTRVEVDNVMPGTAITDTNLHHLAVTKSGSSVVFYIDGVAHAAPAYSTTYNFATPAAIGARGDNLGNSFLGKIDEISIYNRALAVGDIQAIYSAGSAGKCVVAAVPFLISQPTSQTVQAGANVTFAITAGGTAPLAYQWTFNGTNLAGATTAALTLTNVAFGQAGNYAVTVTNAGGSVPSSNAVLTVVSPVAAVRVVGVSGPAGGSVAVPIVLVANGNENALGFSLNFDPTLLAYASLSLGSGATGGALLFNTNQAASGKIGVAVALPADGVFAAGTQEVAVVSFVLPVILHPAATAITFGDVPISRQLADAPGNVLAATYAGGSVSITAVEFEGDVSPRPVGDRALTITDWVLAGRYAARLDYPTNAAEFQRADAAPRATLGDGQITVTDWVQAGRYMAKLDPATPLGGPTSEVPGLAAGATGPRSKGGGGSLTGRQLVVTDAMWLQGKSGTVSVQLAAQGDENAVGFSLSFDPGTLSYTSATLGKGAAGATLFVNASQAAQGRLGFVLSLGTGSQFPAGTAELLKVNLVGPNSGSYPVALSQVPVPRQVSDANAAALNTGYIGGMVTVNPPPTLNIAQWDQNLVLSWPLWATNFGLQQSGEMVSPSATWTNLSAPVGVSNNQNVVTLPRSDALKFFRLQQR